MSASDNDGWPKMCLECETILFHQDMLNGHRFRCEIARGTQSLEASP